MMTVQRSTLNEFRPHEMTGEASDQRWGMLPANWPEEFQVENDGTLGAAYPTIGNGRPFQLVKTIERDGEFCGARYRQQFGCIEITIFND